MALEEMGWYDKWTPCKKENKAETQVIEMLDLVDKDFNSDQSIYEKREKENKQMRGWKI